MWAQVSVSFHLQINYSVGIGVLTTSDDQSLCCHQTPNTVSAIYIPPSIHGRYWHSIDTRINACSKPKSSKPKSSLPVEVGVWSIISIICISIMGFEFWVDYLLRYVGCRYRYSSRHSQITKTGYICTKNSFCFLLTYRSISAPSHLQSPDDSSIMHFCKAQASCKLLYGSALVVKAVHHYPKHHYHK